MPFALSPALKHEIRARLERSWDMEGEDALYVMDLAVHAVNQCVETVGRTAGTAPPRLQEAIMATACMLLEAVTKVE